MDRFAAMSHFVAVVDRKGFAPAARHLHVTPSAVTRMIAALEQHLGVRLLQRTTRSLSLTEAGERYLAQARRILADLDEAESAVGGLAGRPSGRLVLSAPAVFGRLHVAPLVERYLQAHPQMAVDLSLSDRWVNLVEEGIDCAVRIGALADSSLVIRKIGATRRVVVASPAYLAAHGTPAHPDEIAGHRTIRFTALGGQDVWRFRGETGEIRVPLEAHYSTNSADAVLLHAEAGGGLAMVLAYQAEAAVKAGRLAVILDDFEPEPLPIQLVYTSARLLSAKVRSFVDLALSSSRWQFLL